MFSICTRNGHVTSKSAARRNPIGRNFIPSQRNHTVLCLLRSSVLHLPGVPGRENATHATHATPATPSGFQRHRASRFVNACNCSHEKLRYLHHQRTLPLGEARSSPPHSRNVSNLWWRWKASLFVNWVQDIFLIQDEAGKPPPSRYEFHIFLLPVAVVSGDRSPSEGSNSGDRILEKALHVCHIPYNDRQRSSSTSTRNKRAL